MVQNPLNVSNVGTLLCTFQTLNHTWEFILVRKLYEWKKCGKVFRRCERLNQHHSIHTGEKSYKCNVYGNSFSVSSTLHRGLILVRNPANVRNMGRPFTRPHTLLYVREFILVKTSFVCQKCCKAFSYSYQLTVLYGVHSDERPYECKECGKTSGLHGRFIRHQTTHSCKKPFEYYKCKKAFTFIASLKNIRVLILWETRWMLEEAFIITFCSFFLFSWYSAYILYTFNVSQSPH